MHFFVALAAFASAVVGYSIGKLTPQMKNLQSRPFSNLFMTLFQIIRKFRSNVLRPRDKIVKFRLTTMEWFTKHARIRMEREFNNAPSLSEKMEQPKIGPLARSLRADTVSSDSSNTV